MAWTTFTTAQMDAISRRLFMPLILLVNYTLLLFLLMFHWSRRHQNRVRLLFAVGALGVACLVPFADPDDHIISNLNDVSKSCCVLTFLVQITIIGYDLNRKIKFRSVMALTYVAEVLIVADLAMVLLSLAYAFHDDILSEELGQMLPNVCENITLTFIFVFRYYFIILSLGWRDVWANRKLELCWYLLFATHELPFMVLEDVSGLSWESVQALWHRVTLAGCLWIAARTKLCTTTLGSTGDSVTQAPSKQRRSSGARKRNANVIAPKRTKQQNQRSLAGAVKRTIAVINE